MELNVFYQFNQNYVPYAGVSVTSLFESNRAAEQITVYLLLENVDAPSIEKFRALAARYGRRIVVADSAALLQKAESLGIPRWRGSAAANLRLFFPDTLRGVNRILYLDSDTLVLDDLQSLFCADLGGKWMGMVRDSLMCEYLDACGFGRENDYFNSGMILYDVPAWQRNHCGERVVEQVKTVRARYANPDQDLINFTFKGHIAVLDCRYNFQPAHRVYSDRDYFAVVSGRPYYTCGQLQAARETPAILHTYRFLGLFPWHREPLHPDRALFDRYLALSPWADYQKQPGPGGAVYKIERVLYRVLPRGLFFRLFQMLQTRSYLRQERALKAEIQTR